MSRLCFVAYSRAALNCRRSESPASWAAEYRCLYAPRAGGAYDSHHPTAGIAGRIWRCGGCLAARGAHAAAGDAWDRVPRQLVACRPSTSCDCISGKASAKNRLRRRPECGDRVSLGAGPIRSIARPRGGSGTPSGGADRCARYALGNCGQATLLKTRSMAKSVELGMTMSCARRVR
jgi:hypothetical protein